jgi:DNA-binding winged helix-turn-helix (wHTH) protein
MTLSGKPQNRTATGPPTIHPGTIYRFGEFELDAPRFELRRGGRKVRVEPKVLDFLLLLVRSRERLVHRDEVLNALWPGVTVSDASIWRVILEARRALGDDDQRTIVTIRGRGFRLAAQVTEIDPGTRPALPPATVSDPGFVGREASMAAVGARLTDAMAGHGSFVWLSGEPGIGKTRMAEKIASMAQVRGANVIAAHAPAAVEAPPLWLWAQIVRTLAKDRGDEASAQLLTDASPLLRNEEPKEAPARFALFEAVAGAFARASRERALVIVIDDLHRADEPSLRLLEFLAGDVRKNAWLIVGTYRDCAVPSDGRGHALGGLIASTGSLGIPLRRFSTDEVVRLVEVHTGTTPSMALANALFERSGGNPLYVEQLLKTEWAARALETAAQELATTLDLQRGIIESIGRHLDSMSEAGRELLTLAAVLGKQFQLAELAVVSGLSAQTLFDRVDEAVRTSVLVPAHDGRHRFSHVLVRDVLYKRLSSADRAALHHTVGQRLLTHYREAIDTHAAELADHFLRALPGGDPERAIDLGMRAAELQTRLARHLDAAKLLRRTARALALLPGEDPRRVSVQLGLAVALADAGQMGAARDAFLDAAVVAETFRRPQELAEAALGYASVSGDGAQGRVLLERSAAALTGTGGEKTSELRGRVEAALDLARTTS